MRTEGALARGPLLVALVALVVGSVLGPGAASAHGKGGGFHKRVQVVVHPKRVELLVTLDLETGAKAQTLRRGADANKDQRLSDEELAALRERLVSLAMKRLTASISGFPLAPRVEEARLSARDDRTLSESGVSVAVLLAADLPEAVSPGMELEVGDEAPDGSHVHVVAHEATPDGGVASEANRALQAGERLKLRLRGAL